MNRLITFISIIVISLNNASAQFDTAKIYFRLDIDGLDKNAQHKIDSLIYNDHINTNTQLLIVGYADFLGSNEHNKGLSERRSKNVESYLHSLAIPENNIKLCIGKGEIDRAIKLPDGYAPDRRVDIVVQRNIKKLKKATTKPLPQKPAEKPNLAKLTLETVTIGQTIRLENIYFYISRHVVTNESYPQLNILYDFMERNATVKIQIEGHVCCVKNVPDAEDEDTREIALSVNRAKHIYEYLAQKGIERDRMRYMGFGISRPLIWPERTPKDEEMNRRVEIRILEK